jgi:hypothetical protein
VVSVEWINHEGGPERNWYYQEQVIRVE